MASLSHLQVALDPKKMIHKEEPPAARHRLQRQARFGRRTKQGLWLERQRAPGAHVRVERDSPVALGEALHTRANPPTEWRMSS